MNGANLFPCPCCGQRTRAQEAHGTYEICEVCGWEDDDAQYRNPDMAGGANRLSLNQARAALRGEQS
jgi:hypothetical protein